MGRLKYIAVTLMALFLLTGCNEKTKRENPYRTDTNLSSHEANVSEQIALPERNETEENAELERELALEDERCDGERLTFRNDAGETLTLCREERTLRILHRDTPLLLVTLYDSNRTFSTGMLPYLNDLQTDRSDTLTTLALDISNGTAHPKDALFHAVGGDKEKLIRLWSKRFERNGSVPVPWTLLYIDGELVRHYEGLVPIEMLTHDLESIYKEE